MEVHPLRCALTPANRHDCPLLRPTLQTPAHLDAGSGSATTRDLRDELGCQALISQQRFPLQAGARQVTERTHSWPTRGFAQPQVRTQRHTRVIDASITLATAIITTRRPTRTAWTTHRRATPPSRRP